MATPLGEREIRVLDILREDRNLSQRRLAKRLGLALGLVNALLKQLVQKGYVNVVQTDARHVAYLCTPKGMAQKAVRLLTHLENSLEFYQQAKRLVCHGVGALERSGARRVAIYGRGDVGEIVFVALRNAGLEAAALVDEAAAGERWLGQTVRSVDQCRDLGIDAVVVAMAAPPEPLLEDLRARLGKPLLVLGREEAPA